jgi:ABC-2 type transport system ATP-binding protein
MAYETRESVIETISLTKIYKDFWGRDKVKAVDNLNLTIPKGQVFGLLGPNGSGKTTTIKMLLGLLFPSSGRAKIFGKSPTNVEVKARIGYLPEETRLYQFLNSWETLDFYGRIFNLESAERKRRAEALVEMVGLGPAASRPVGQYSKGMARRIGLAQSLINDPDLLILDEPTSGLDPIGTRQIKDLLLELKKRGKTIVLCSHLLADVEDVCDQVSIMYGGKMLCSGEIQELLSQQDQTQVQLENLTESSLEELKSYLKKYFSENLISIGSPRDRLEQFFLRMVRQAEKEMYTYGARNNGQVSDFLKVSSDSGEALLDKLTTSAEPVLKQNIETAAPPKEEIERQLLSQLAAAPKEEPIERPVIKEEVKPPVKQENVDRNLLNNLLDNADDDSKRRDGLGG